MSVKISFRKAWYFLSPSRSASGGGGVQVQEHEDALFFPGRIIFSADNVPEYALSEFIIDLEEQLRNGYHYAPDQAVLGDPGPLRGNIKQAQQDVHDGDHQEESAGYCQDRCSRRIYP